MSEISPLTIYVVVVPVSEGNYALDVNMPSPDGTGEAVRLQSGYKSPAAALEAFITAITIAPPDLKVYDEAMEQIPQLLDQARDQGEVIERLQATIKEMEEALFALAGPAKTTNRFLAGRQHGDPAPAPRERDENAGPPPLRRAVMTAGHGTRAGEITAGPIRGRGSEEP